MGAVAPPRAGPRGGARGRHEARASRRIPTLNWWLLLLVVGIVLAVSFQNLWLRRRAEGRPLFGAPPGDRSAGEREDGGDERP